MLVKCAIKDWVDGLVRSQRLIFDHETTLSNRTHDYAGNLDDLLFSEVLVSLSKILSLEYIANDVKLRTLVVTTAHCETKKMVPIMTFQNTRISKFVSMPGVMMETRLDQDCHLVCLSKIPKDALAELILLSILTNVSIHPKNNRIYCYHGTYGVLFTDAVVFNHKPASLTAEAYEIIRSRPSCEQKYLNAIVEMARNQLQTVNRDILLDRISPEVSHGYVLQTL
jgi:hypothetical protein